MFSTLHRNVYVKNQGRGVGGGEEGKKFQSGASFQVIKTVKPPPVWSKACYIMKNIPKYFILEMSPKLRNSDFSLKICIPIRNIYNGTNKVLHYFKPEQF